MNRFGYYLLVAGMAFFAGIVGATSIDANDPIPSTEQVLSYIVNAHSQDQAY